MKKSKLKQIIKEAILEEKGYSNYVPGKETSGLDKKTLDSILLRIAKGEKPSEEEHSVARGNRILDKADPENVKKILNGEELGEIKVNDPGLQFLKNKLTGIIQSDWDEDEEGDENKDQYLTVINDVKTSNNKEELLRVMSDYLHDENLAKDYIEGQDEVERMQELAGLKQEIKINNPKRLSFDYKEDDDDGESKIISISKHGEEWWGNEPYLKNPGVINIEFSFEEGKDHTYEQEQMDKLVLLLKRITTPYKKIDVNNDGKLIYIQIPKHSLILN